MTTLYFRAMVGEDDRPQIGRSARLLGIRPEIDIDVMEVPDAGIDARGYVRVESERGESKNLVVVAVRNTKGMSTSIEIMVWSFGLAAECGEVEADAIEFGRYFQQGIFNPNDNTRIEYRTDIFRDLDANWWCRVCPQGLSLTGVDTPETAYLMTEIGVLLYQQL